MSADNEDLFNSKTKAEAIGKLSSVAEEVHNLCKIFCEINSYKITADLMIFWNSFGDKFGKSEDLPLIQDLIYIANNESELLTVPNNPPRLFNDTPSSRNGQTIII